MESLTCFTFMVSEKIATLKFLISQRIIVKFSVEMCVCVCLCVCVCVCACARAYVYGVEGGVGERENRCAMADIWILGNTAQSPVGYFFFFVSTKAKGRFPWTHFKQ